MVDGTVYNDARGPLEVSTATYEQELFYCEFVYKAGTIGD